MSFISGETFREDEKCGLQEISYLQVPDPWLAVQKNTSYKEMFKIGWVDYSKYTSVMIMRQDNLKVYNALIPILTTYKSNSVVMSQNLNYFNNQ